MADDLINCIVMRFINILLLHIHNALEVPVLGPALDSPYLSAQKSIKEIYGWTEGRTAFFSSNLKCIKHLMVALTQNKASGDET